MFQIPLVNSVRSEFIPDGTLVKYRGMVQDQFDTEFYLKAFTVINKETGEKVLMCFPLLVYL